MSLFFKAIIDFKNVPAPRLWKLSEDYFSLRSSALGVNSSGERKIIVAPVSSSQPFVIKALKVATYFSIIVPLFLLTTRAYYRNKYHIELTKSNASTATTIAEVSSSVLSPAENNSNVINRIKQAKATGLKVALFMGRTDDQPMPTEQGWLWVSLDQAMNKSSSENHPHLQMDFNHPSIKDLVGLFDRVVVDSSTLKFFPGDCWKVLHTLAASNKDSEVYVEAIKSIVHSTMSLDEVYRSHPGQGLLEISTALSQEDPRIEGIKTTFLEDERDFLSQIFESVELHQNEPHQYRSEEEKKEPSTYWVLKGKKTSPRLL